MNNDKAIKIDENVLRNINFAIKFEERANDRSNKYSEHEMVDKLCSIIKTEVDKVNS